MDEISRPSEKKRLPAENSSPDQTLPQVEPPTAGFIIQLFVIPATIVTIIAVVYLLFSWLAHLGTSPLKLAQDLERGGDHSWQTAFNLARELQNPINQNLRKNAVLADRLADLLQRSINDSYPTGADPLDQNKRKNTIQLRVFLCRALGEFEVASVIPSLVQAATTENYVSQYTDDFGDEQVRRSALEALAVLADHLGPGHLRAEEDVMAALHEAASERSGPHDSSPHRDLLRSTAAYVLGVLGGDRNLDRLAHMRNDAASNVRYNAATGLARHGDTRAVDVLLEMLDPDETDAIDDEIQAAGRDWKRKSIIVNALRASEQLARTNSSSDLKELHDGVEQLLHVDVNGHIQAEARKTLLEFEKR